MCVKLTTQTHTHTHKELIEQNKSIFHHLCYKRCYRATTGVPFIHCGQFYESILRQIYTRNKPSQIAAAKVHIFLPSCLHVRNSEMIPCHHYYVTKHISYISTVSIVCKNQVYTTKLTLELHYLHKPNQTSDKTLILLILIKHLHFRSKVHRFLLGWLLLTRAIAGDVRALPNGTSSWVVLMTVRVRKLRRHRGSRTGRYTFGWWRTRRRVIIGRIFSSIVEVSIQCLSTPFIVVSSTCLELSFDSVYGSVVACSRRFETLGTYSRRCRAWR